MVAQPCDHVAIVERNSFLNPYLLGLLGCTELFQFLLLRVEGIQVFLCEFFSLFP